MMDYMIIIQFVYNLFLFLLWMLFLNSVLTRRFPYWVTLLLWLACYAACWELSVMSAAGSPWRLPVSSAIILAVSLLAYNKRWTRVLFSVGIALAIMMVCELVLLLLFPDIMWAMVGVGVLETDALLRSSGVCAFSFLLNWLFLWLASRLLNRYGSRFSSEEWLLYAMFLLCQTTLLGSWLQISIYGNGVSALIWLGADMLLCIAADTALYFVMRGMAQRAVLRVENATLSKQISAQRDHYSALTEQYENVRRMRHDIANHVHTIQVLLNEGKTGEAESYAADLIPQTEYAPGLGQCANPVVDAFLFSRIRELRQQGIELAEEVVLPPYLHLSNIDLITAFVNLLDNAAEACSGLEDKRISLTARITRGFLFISTENPLPPGGKNARDRRIPELERGVGFRILDDMARRCDGRFTYSAEDGVFRTELALREEGYPC